jgi:hypothetical protein
MLGMLVLAGIVLQRASGQTNLPAASAVASTEILTPVPPVAPRVNGPDVFGVRPGSPFVLLHHGPTSMIARRYENKGGSPSSST